MNARDTGTETREKLLAAARALMLTKGFVATGVDDVCKAAGVTKGAFFHYFPNKESLGLAVAEAQAKGIGGAFANAPFMREIDPLKRLHGYLDTALAVNADPSRPIGCLLGIFTQELAETHPEVRTFCAATFEHLRVGLEGILAAAFAAEAPKAKVDVASLADTFTALLQGSLILARARQDRQIVARQIEHFRAYVNALMGKAPKAPARSKARPRANGPSARRSR